MMEPSSMSHLRRVYYAAALTAVAVAIFILVSAVFAPDVMAASLKAPYWLIVVFVLAYLAVPFVGRYIKMR